MKKLMSMLLVGMMLVSMVGCESEEERQSRILEAAKNQLEAGVMANNPEAYALLTDKEWEITKVDDGYVVTLHGNINYYMMSCAVAYQFDISNDMYITKIRYTIGDYTEEETVEKNPNSKLDI